MKPLKIGIVEDELIIANNIALTLTNIGYEITEIAISYSEALVMLQEEKPDLVLLDINLSGKKDGIDVAGYVNEKQRMPFIFLTANSDMATLERAKKVMPNAYLIKPFTKEELFVSIEVAFNNYNVVRPATQADASKAEPKQEAVFLRNKQSFTKVLFSEILFVESAGNYVTIHFNAGDKLLHRSPISEFAMLLPETSFYRCHRSYIVQLNAIQKIDENELVIGDHRVPVGKDRLNGLLDKLGIIN